MGIKWIGNYVWQRCLPDIKQLFSLTEGSSMWTAVSSGMKQNTFFSLKQRWQKHHAELAEHRPKADFFLWNRYVSLLRFCWKDLYKHLHQMECVISRELVWMISIPFPSLAVSNSYFVKLHPKNFFFFWSLRLTSTLPVVLANAWECLAVLVCESAECVYDSFYLRLSVFCEQAIIYSKHTL